MLAALGLTRFQRIASSLLNKGTLGPVDLGRQWLAVPNRSPALQPLRPRVDSLSWGLSPSESRLDERPETSGRQPLVHWETDLSEPVLTNVRQRTHSSVPQSPSKSPPGSLQSSAPFRDLLRLGLPLRSWTVKDASRKALLSPMKTSVNSSRVFLQRCLPCVSAFTCSDP